MTSHFHLHWLLWAVFVGSSTALVATPAHAQRRTPNARASREPSQPSMPVGTPSAGRSGIIPRGRVTFTAEREAAALTFVRENRPELPAVLEDLKARQPAEYQRAICDLFWTSEMLADMRQGDAQRHDYALRSWQLESLAHLQAARLAGATGNIEQLQAELNQTVEQLVDAQIESSSYEVRRMEAQLRRAQDHHKRLAGRRDELVRERAAALSQAIEQSAIPPAENPSKPISPATGVE